MHLNWRPMNNFLLLVRRIDFFSQFTKNIINLVCQREAARHVPRINDIFRFGRWTFANFGLDETGIAFGGAGETIVELANHRIQKIQTVADIVTVNEEID